MHPALTLSVLDERPNPPVGAEPIQGALEGFITERHLDLADVEFPGIVHFHRACMACPRTRPRTFLELLVRFKAFGAK